MRSTTRCGTPAGGAHRYFWFEISGIFHEAEGVLRDDGALALEWRTLRAAQFLQRTGPDSMFLEMRCPDDGLLPRVDFARL